MAARYTEADLATINKAIMDALSGKRVSEVTIAGRTIRYEAAAVSVLVPLLKQTRAEIEEYLASQAGTQRTRARIVVSGKGL